MKIEDFSLMGNVQDLNLFFNDGTGVLQLIEVSKAGKKWSGSDSRVQKGSEVLAYDEDRNTFFTFEFKAVKHFELEQLVVPAKVRETTILSSAADIISAVVGITDPDGRSGVQAQVIALAEQIHFDNWLRFQSKETKERIEAVMNGSANGVKLSWQETLRWMQALYNETYDFTPLF